MFFLYDEKGERRKPTGFTVLITPVTIKIGKGGQSKGKEGDPSSLCVGGKRGECLSSPGGGKGLGKKREGEDIDISFPWRG